MNGYPQIITPSVYIFIICIYYSLYIKISGCCNLMILCVYNIHTEIQVFSQFSHSVYTLFFLFEGMTNLFDHVLIRVFASCTDSYLEPCCLWPPIPKHRISAGGYKKKLEKDNLPAP